MKKLRLSYSLLSYWDRGDVQGAVDCYFHVDKAGNAAMENGKKVHEELAEYISTYSSFPEWFFNYPLQLPECEKAVTVPFSEIVDLKGVFDCLDPVNKTLFEFKTGNSDSLEWARTWQIPLYFLIAEIAKIDIEKAILIRNDGKKSDFVVVHNSQRLRSRARNIVESLSPEIWEYFNNEGLI